MKKKWLRILLAALMIVSLLSFGAFTVFAKLAFSLTCQNIDTASIKSVKLNADERTPTGDTLVFDCGGASSTSHIMRVTAKEGYEFSPLPEGWSYDMGQKNVLVKVGVPVTTPGGDFISIPSASLISLPQPTKPDDAEWLVNEGENHVWYKLTENTPTTDPATYTLTIGGTGAMPEIDAYERPWNDKRTNITEVVIKSGVTSVGNLAFFQLSKLTSVTIPSSVKSIGDFAFNSCTSLASITFPEGLTGIGGEMFTNCSSLTTITVKAETPPSLGDILSSDDPCAIETIYVPASSVEAYKQADIWSDYADKIEAIPEITVADILATVEGSFPTKEADAWVCGGCVALKTTEKLKFSNGDTTEQSIALTTALKPDGSNYKYSSWGGWSIVFNMEDGKLVSITFDANNESYKSLNGTYTVPVGFEITNGTPESDSAKNHGYIAIDKTSASEGDTVTVTVTPNEGYQLKANSLKVTYNDGEEKTIIPTPVQGKDNEYTFEMPAYAVTVTAEFEESTIKELFDSQNVDVYSTFGMDTNPEATWDKNTETLTIKLLSDIGMQWGNQVTLNTGITTLDTTKEYQVSFTATATTDACYGVTFKMFDDNQIAFANQSITLSTTPYTYVSDWAKPLATSTNGRIVFDFGWDSAQTITVTNISIKERTPEAPPHTHAFTYTANNGKITATCVEGCDDGYDTNPLTLTLTAPASLVYNGNAKAFTFADGEATAWTGAGLELPDIIYWIKQSGQSEYLPLFGMLKFTGNYMAQITVDRKTAQIEFTIDKATPYIKTAPAPNDIEYGEKLSDSTLVGGYVQVSSTDSTQIGGQFVWTNPDTAPGIDDSEVTLYDVTFTPADTKNYNTVSCKVTVKVDHTHSFTGDYIEYDTTNHKWAKKCSCGEYDTANALTGVDVPTANMGLVYDNSEKIGVAEATGYTVSNGKKTDAGEYTATATLSDGYIWSDGTTAAKEIKWSIAKASVNEPTVTGTYTYTGSEQSATISGKEAFMTENGDIKGTNAGTYTITYTLDGNHEWATGSDGTVTWTIAKAQNAIHDLTIGNWKDTENGTAPTATADFGEIEYLYSKADVRDFSIETLPTAAGKYIVKAFVLGTDNYDAAMEEKEFTIYATQKSGGDIGEGETKPVVQIEIENGFDPNIELEVEVVVKADAVVAEDHKAIVDYKELAEKKEVVAGVYDVRLLLNGEEIQLDTLGSGTVVTVRMLIPEDLIGKEFRLVHVHAADDVQTIVQGEEAAVGTYVIDEDGYLVTKIDRFSEFVFLRPDTSVSLWWLWVLIALIVIGGVGTTYYFVRKKKKDQ